MGHLFVLFQVSISVSYSIMSTLSKPSPYRTLLKETMITLFGTLSSSSVNFELQPFPASPSTIATFVILSLVIFYVKWYQTINNYLSALHRLHVFCHFDTQAFLEIHVKLTQTGLEKSMVHVPHHKATSPHQSCHNSAPILTSVC